jgi:hypothetical protein
MLQLIALAASVNELFVQDNKEGDLLQVAEAELLLLLTACLLVPTAGIGAEVAEQGMKI